jgi:hypothetical protein
MKHFLITISVPISLIILCLFCNIITSCNGIVKETIKTEDVTVKIEKVNGIVDTINIIIPKDNKLIIHAGLGIYALCRIDTTEKFTRTLHPIKDGVIEFKILNFDKKFKFVKYED